jgi:hypothetical protein
MIGMASSALLTPNSFSRSAEFGLINWPCVPWLSESQVSKRNGQEEQSDQDIPLRNEDIERANNLGERSGLVGSPLLDSDLALDKDDEVVVGTLVVAPGLKSVASHFDWLFDCLKKMWCG